MTVAGSDDVSSIECLTGPQPAGLAVFRLRGPGAWSMLSAHLQPRPALRPGRLGYHRLVDESGVVIDDVVLADLGSAPPPGGEAASTGPWELSVHGGPEVVRQVLALAGRCGLSATPTPADDDVEGWVERLLPLARTELAVRTLLAQSQRPKQGGVAGEALRVLLGRPQVALYGLPNVGKSTLLNALAGRDVAITADLPGTTRDYVSAEAVLAEAWGGVLVELIDTPGLRDTPDAIEAEAQRLARPVLASAAVRVLVLDASRRLTDVEAAELVRPDDRRLVVWNKGDLADVERDLEAVEGVRVSARTGRGVRELGELIARRLGVTPDVCERRQRLPVELLTVDDSTGGVSNPVLYGLDRPPAAERPA